MLHIDNFHLRGKCGEGDDGVVWKAMRRADASWCAVKILRAPLSQLVDSEGVPKEAAILSQLSHPNIVKYIGWGKIYRIEMILAKNEQICCFPGEIGAFIVTELVEGDVLAKRITNNNFGRTKRQQIFRQLLEAVQYMHSKNVTHGSIFLDNVLISKSQSASLLPRLVLCDMGSASNLTGLSEAQKDMRTDRDRLQCGGVLLAIFSSVSLHNQVNTNKMMQKDALRLAKDLIDAKKIMSWEEALRSPFLNEIVSDDRFVVTTPMAWNDEIVEMIATHVIGTGNTNDFASASMVCKQFYCAFQRQFLWSKQSELLTEPFDETDHPPFNSAIEDVSLWLERTPFAHDWSIIALYSEGDMAFELELLELYIQQYSANILTIQDLVANLSETTQQWDLILLHMHDMCGGSSNVGQLKIRQLTNFGRGRARLNRTTRPADIDSERKLFLRIVSKLKENMIRFHKVAREYLRQSNQILQADVDVLAL